MRTDYTDPNITFPRIEARVVQTEFGVLISAWLRRNAYGHRQQLVADMYCETEAKALKAIEKLGRANRAEFSDGDLTKV